MCWTPEQKKIVDAVVGDLAKYCTMRINSRTSTILSLDKRPRETYTPENPDVFFPYVAQGMLEELISELQKRV